MIIWKMQHWEGTPSNSYSLDNRNVTLGFRLIYFIRILLLPLLIKEGS